MPVLYLLEQGSTLRKEGDVFVVTKDDEELQRVRAIEVEQIIIFGNINLTTPVIAYILEHDIDCVFCNSYGKFHGRLVSTATRLGSLRLRQADAALNSERRLYIATSFIRGKLHNCKTVLMRYRREYDLSVLDKVIDVVNDGIDSLKNCNNLGSLHGIEGAAATAYFSAYKLLLKNDMGFNGRVHRPPTDPVNSLLSYLYTLLTYNFQAAIDIVGLDPFIGYLHSVEQARPNLALDLMEEFRHIIVDTLVLWLVNTGVVNEDDFERAEEPDQMVKIKHEALKKVIHHYEMRVQSRIYHPLAAGKTSYRRCFELQARQLARYLNNEAPEYNPFYVR